MACHRFGSARSAPDQLQKHLTTLIPTTPLLLILTALLISPIIAIAQETTTTATAQETKTTTTTATQSAPTDTVSTDIAATHTIVLLGEKVGADPTKPSKGPFPDLIAITSSTLGGKVTDFTSAGITIAETAEMAAAPVEIQPDIAVIFAGLTDEKLEIENASQRASLTTLITELKSKNPNMRVFLVPAATTVGALTSANLRLVAGDLAAVFVPLGTEVGGQPYREALEGVKSELRSTPESAVADKSATNPSNTISIRSGKVEAANPEQDVKLYDERKASLQRELNRIAGQSGAIGSIGQAAASSAGTTLSTSLDTTAPESKLSGMTYPSGGTLTKRGAEAHESIRMRPLPAVKAFRPEIPVPRNDLEIKEPALAR